jgi:hypothetical protein
LTAESTRLQALRRAQKAEELKTRRDATPTRPAAPDAPTANGPGAARSAAGNPRAAQPAAKSDGPVAAPAPAAGPAAVRRAAAETPAEREQRLQEIRDSIARRLRNGELSADQALAAYAAVDKRLGNALGEKQAQPAVPASPVGAGVDAEKPAIDLQAIEESLNRRLRNGGLDPDKAAEIFGDVSRRIDNAQGAKDKAATTPNAPPAARPQRSATAGETATPELETPSLRERVLEAQQNLAKRMRNAELTPEQAAAQKEVLRKRTERAVEKAKSAAASSEASAGAAPEAPQPARTGAHAPPAGADGAGAARRGAGAAPTPATLPPAAGRRGDEHPATPPVPAAQPAPARPAPVQTPPPVPPARPLPATPPPAGGGKPRDN